MKLRDQAYDKFTDNLLSRKILPGQFITQRELSALTGLPLGAIRELIPRLEADGLLRTIPQRGMQITHVDLNLIRNAFQLRSILELEAVSNFTLSSTDAERQMMEDGHNEIIMKAKNGITKALVEKAQDVDWAFHDTLIDHLNNKIISDIYRVNTLKIRLIRQEFTRILPEIMISTIKDHLEIIKAIKTGDPEKAKTALAAHLENSRIRALNL